MGLQLLLPQGGRLQQLRKELDQRSAEVGAQQMALTGLGGERDACRSAVEDASQRAEVRTRLLGFSKSRRHPACGSGLAAKRAISLHSLARQAPSVDTRPAFCLRARPAGEKL